MSNRTLNLSDTLYQYLLDHSVRESTLMRELRALHDRMTWAEREPPGGEAGLSRPRSDSGDSRPGE